jgi:hypothetical protein
MYPTGEDSWLLTFQASEVPGRPGATGCLDLTKVFLKGQRQIEKKVAPRAASRDQDKIRLEGMEPVD